MKKSELKTGMWVTTKNGNNYMVVKDVQTELYGYQEVALIGIEGFMIGSDLNEDLSFNQGKDWGIVEVRGNKEGNINGNTYTGKFLPTLWKRKEPLVLTLDELIRKAGYEKGEAVIKVEH